MAKLLLVLIITSYFFSTSAIETKCNSFDLIKDPEKYIIKGPFTAKQVEEHDKEIAKKLYESMDNLYEHEILIRLMNVPFKREWLALKNKYRNGDSFYYFSLIYDFGESLSLKSGEISIIDDMPEGMDLTMTSEENTILVRNNCIIGIRGDLIKFQD